jgi:hypothetical protein
MSCVFDSVLEALARALRLDGAERAHLFDLARLILTYNRMELAADPGQMLMICTAEPARSPRRHSAFLEAGPRRHSSQSYTTLQVSRNRPRRARLGDSLAASPRDDGRI